MKNKIIAIMSALTLGITLANGQQIQSLGTMEFNDEGILFVTT